MPKPISESNEKPKNRLNRLHNEAREKSDGEKLNDIDLIRNFFQEEWYEANKERLGGYENLTDVQSQERDRYIAGIEISRIRNAINEIIADKDSSPEKVKRFELLRMKLSLP